MELTRASNGGYSMQHCSGDCSTCSSWPVCPLCTGAGCRVLARHQSPPGATAGHSQTTLARADPCCVYTHDTSASSHLTWSSSDLKHYNDIVTIFCQTLWEIPHLWWCKCQQMQWLHIVNKCKVIKLKVILNFDKFSRSTVCSED